MKKMHVNLVILFLISVPLSYGQTGVTLSELPEYPFIHYDMNHLDLVHDNASFKTLYAKFDTLLSRGSNRISIVHIGGSHIQADIYTHRIRQEMQSLYPGVLGARGFFFPYKIAQTNSPSNLKIKYTGEWISRRNTQAEPPLSLGVSGITSALISDSASVSIIANYDSLTRYDFNRVRVYCNAANDSCIPHFWPEKLVSCITLNKQAGYVQYDLKSYSDSLSLTFNLCDSLRPFELYGISLDNNDPGVIYNSIGVNGAMLKSYLQCALFAEQLKSLQPDLIVISIGTNEGNSRNFDAAAYRAEYIQMIDLVRNSVPGAALLLTVPNDSYLNKRYVNHNTAVIRDIIFSLARENGCAVWDFYTIMGGLNSAKLWYDNGLMYKDHIHFNKAGYLIKGDLFYSAFMESWMEQKNNE